MYTPGTGKSRQYSRLELARSWHVTLPYRSYQKVPSNRKTGYG